MFSERGGGMPPSNSSSADDWLTPGRFAGLLALLIFAAFPGVVLGTNTFVFRDFGSFGYPLAHYHRESFWQGEVPLLNPLNDFGLPFLAQWNTMTLYPGSLIYLLLPLSWSLGMFCLLHLFLAGLGMYFLAHRWTENRTAAALTGLAFAFNGLSLSCLMWPNNIAALGWMPWVVLALERAWREGSARVWPAAVVGALQVLAGAPEIILQTWLFAGALWIGQFIFGKLPRGPMLRRTFLVVALVSGLTAAQMIPFLDLLAHSNRDSAFGSSFWAMPGTGWANLLVPLFYSFQWNSGVYYQYQQQWTSSYYLGAGVLALGLLAVWQVRERRVWLLGAVMFLSLILAQGDQAFVYSVVRKVFPFLGFVRFPIKFVVLAVFAAPLLAGYAFKHYETFPVAKGTAAARRVWFVWFLLSALIAVLLWFAFRYPEFKLSADEWRSLWQNGLSRFVFLTAILGLLVVLPRFQTRRSRRLAQLALLALVWLDVLTHAPSQNPTVGRSAYDPGLVKMSPAPTLGESRAMVSPAANAQMLATLLTNQFEDFTYHRLGLVADCNLLENIPKVDGFYSLYLREERPVRTALYQPGYKYSEPLADFLSVSQVTAPGKIMEWKQRTNFLSVATAGQRPIYAEDAAALKAMLEPTFDPRRVVYLPLAAQGVVRVTNTTEAKVVSRRFTAHRIELATEAMEPSLLVLSQAYYHPWKVYVNGAPAQIWRANHGFQAVEIPPGHSEVRLTYEDRGFYFGAIISAVSWLGCIVFWLRQRRNKPTAVI